MIIKDVMCKNESCPEQSVPREVFLRRISDTYLCESCGQPCVTVLSATPAHFKGKGWFATDGKY